MDDINLYQKRHKWRSAVKAVMNHRVPQNAEIF
jgi:hypothetical protein